MTHPMERAALPRALACLTAGGHDDDWWARTIVDWRVAVARSGAVTIGRSGGAEEVLQPAHASVEEATEALVARDIVPDSWADESREPWWCRSRMSIECSECNRHGARHRCPRCGGTGTTFAWALGEGAGTAAELAAVAALGPDVLRRTDALCDIFLRGSRVAWTAASRSVIWHRFSLEVPLAAASHLYFVNAHATTWLDYQERHDTPEATLDALAALARDGVYVLTVDEAERVVVLAAEELP